MSPKNKGRIAILHLIEVGLVVRVVLDLSWWVRVLLAAQVVLADPLPPLVVLGRDWASEPWGADGALEQASEWAWARTSHCRLPHRWAKLFLR